jgi:hypothetical protein
MNQSFIRARKERSEKEDKDVEEVLRGDKPMRKERSTLKPSKREEGATPRKRTYKESTTERKAPPRKNYGARDEGVQEKRKSYKPAERNPSVSKNSRPKVEKPNDAKRPYKSSSPSKRPTDRRR